MLYYLYYLCYSKFVTLLKEILLVIHINRGKKHRKETRWKVKRKERKNERKFKINLKSINYSYLLFQTRFTYFTCSCED